MLHSDTFYAFLITALSLTVVATLLSRFNIPTIVGFVLTGVLVGPSGFGWVRSLPAAQMISELGIIFLMFALGLEVSLDHLKRMIRPLVTLGAGQVVLTSLVGFVFFYYLLDLSWVNSYVWSICLSLSSTAIVLKLLQDKRETETPYGRVNIIVLLFQDIAALPLMASIPLIANLSASSQPYNLSFLSTVGGIILFITGCFFLGRFIIPRAFSEVMRTQSREVFFFSILSMTFVIAFLAEKVGLSMSLGAFVAGVLISESPYNKQALAELGPLRDIFLGFFFASLGMMVDAQFIFEHWRQLLWIIPALFLMKFTVTYAISRLASGSHGVSLASALSITQIGEFSFILAASSLTYQLITPDEFQYFLAVSVSSLIFTPLLFSIALKGSAHASWSELAELLNHFAKNPLRGFFPAVIFPEKPTQPNRENTPLIGDWTVQPRRTLVIGVGHAGQKILEELNKNGVPCVGIDLNIENIKKIQSLGIEGLYGDSTAPDVLISAGIEHAHLIIVTVSGKHVTPKVVAVAKRLNSDVNILVRVHYLLELSDLKNLHRSQIVVSESETAKTLIQKALNCYGISEIVEST